MKKFLLFVLFILGLSIVSAQTQIIASYDFEDATQDVNWQYVNQANGWFIGSAPDVNNTPDGSRAIYISCNNGDTNTYLSTQSCSWAFVDIAIPVGYAEITLDFDWKCRGEEHYDYMRVYVGPVIETLPSGTPPPDGAQPLINELRSTNKNYFNGYDGHDYTLYPGWNHHQYSFPGTAYAGQSVRLYLYWYNDQYDFGNNNPPAAVDNIQLTGVNCGSPSAVAISNLTASQAEVTFTPALPDDNAWEYICAAKGSAIDNETPVLISDTTFTLQDLTANTSYTLYIRTVCSDDEYSLWKQTDFRTPCVAIDQLPYIENFDSYTAGNTSIPNCWTAPVTYEGAPEIVEADDYNGNYAYSAPNSLKFATSTTPTTAVSPQFAADIHTLQVTFQLANEGSYSGTFEVGVMSDPYDISSFEQVETFTPEGNAFQKCTVNFSNTTLAGPNRYIAFRQNSNYSYFYYWIDDIVVDVAPSCNEPHDLAIDNPTMNSADLVWQDADGETTWQVLAVPDGTEPDFSQAVNVTSSPHTLTGLDPNTAYQVYLRTVCANGNGYSNWTSITFMTTSGLPAQVPYFCDFEDDGENILWTLVNGDATNQWHVGTPADEANSVLYISKDNGVGNSYDETASSHVWACRDIQFGNGTEFNLSFKWKAQGESNSDYIQLYMGPPMQVSEGTTTVPEGVVEISSMLNQQSEWTTSNFVLDGSYANSVKRLYFLWSNDDNNGTNPPAAIDSILITVNDCGRPYNLAVSGTGETSADITFTPASHNDNAWQYVIGTLGFDPNLTDPTDAWDTIIHLEDLTADTPYEIYVRTNCDNNYSFWSAPLTFRTACPEFMTLPYSENFDNYGTDLDYPTCWFRLDNYPYSGDYPKLDRTYSASGESSIRFYGYDNSYAIGILPPVDINNNPVNTLSISLRMLKTQQSDNNCEIGVMTDPSLASTFTQVARISLSEITELSVWKEFDLSLDAYTGTGNYIALRLQTPASLTGAFYIDDVSIYETPTCAKPTDVKISQITSNSAVIDWTPRNNESIWKIAVVPAGEDISATTPIDIEQHPFVITELTENTKYDAYVSAVCDDGNVSVWTSPVTFATHCTPISITLPWSENFDGCATGADAALPDCWMKYTDYSTAYPYPDGTQASSGTVSMYFFSTTTNYSYLTGPALDLSQFAGSPLLLTCKTFIANNTDGRMNIGYMTDPGDLGTFTLLKALYPSDYAAVNTWYPHDILLPESLPETVYLAFVAPKGAYNNVYLDDVALDYVPDCSAPSNLQFSNIAGASALVSWTASPYGTVDYTVEYSETGQDNWMPISGIADTRVLLSGLMQTTSYDVRVFANCNTTESDTITGSFTTGCLAGGEIAIGDGTTTSYYIPVSNFLGFPGWIGSPYSHTHQIFEASELGGPTQIKGLKLDYASATALTAKTDVTIYLAHTAQSTFDFGTSWIPMDSATQVYSGDLNCSQGWNTFMFDTPFDYNGTDNLALIMDDNSNDYNCDPFTSKYYEFRTHSAPNKTLYYYDETTNPDPANPPSGTTYNFRNNVIFLADCDNTVTCAAPNAFISAVDDHSATVEWAPGNDETSWEIEYKPVSDTEWMPVGELHASPHVLNGLTSNENYTLRIRSVCSPDEYSDWTILNFATVCSPVTELPLTEKFDAGTGTDGNYFADCWTRGTNSIDDIPHTTDDYYYSGSHSLYFYSSSSEYSYTATPRLDENIQMDSLQISFYIFTIMANNSIEVGIMTDPKDYSTFTPVGTATPSELNTWQLAEINTANYSGTGHYIALRVPQWTNNYIYIDNISIHYIPSCKHVNDLTVNNIKAHSATVSWTAGGNETVWEYLYGPAGTVDLNNDEPYTATDNSAELLELTANTLYEVYVRSMCEVNDYSPWMTVNFRTVCDAISTLPYVENFDNYTAGTSLLPDCWSAPVTYQGTPQIVTTAGDDDGNNFAYSLPNSLKFSGNNYPTAVSPQFAADIHDLQVTFQLKREDPASGTLEVGVMSDPFDTSTFESAKIITPSDNLYHKYTVKFENTTLDGPDRYIAFRQKSSSYYYYYWMDDVTIDVIPNCDEPYNLAIQNLTGTSADLTWQNADDESTCQLLTLPYGTAPDFTEAVEVTSTSYLLNDLIPNTVYTIYLRTVCSDAGYSSPTYITFMTPSGSPAQVPYFHDFEDDAENGKWILVNGEAGSKWYIGTPTGAQDGVLYVSNDDGQHNSYDNTTISSVWAYRDIQFGDGAEFNLSFKWKADGESSYGNVYDYMQFYIGPPMPVTAGSSTAPENAIVTSERLNLSSNWATANCVLDNSFANTTQRLYFLWVNDEYGYYDPPAAIDSIQITVNDCGRPYNLAVSNIGETSADITFTPALSGDGAWQYALGLAGFDPDVATPVDIYSTSIPLSDLTANTRYEIYVRTICTSGDYSAWSAPVAFKTTCEIHDVPYFENFDSYTAGVNSLPDCWSTPDDSYAPHIETDDNSYYYDQISNSTPNSLEFTGNNQPTVVSPQFAADIHSLQVTFYLKAEHTTYSGTFEVGVMSDPYDISTFESVRSIEPDNTDYNEYTVYFPNTTLEGGERYIAFRQHPNEGAPYEYLYWLDDVSVESMSTCLRPLELTGTTSSTNSVTLEWTEEGTATEWEIIYGTTNFNPTTAGTIVPANTNPFTVTGLSASTTYDFYVRAVCSPNEVSNWSNVATFATQCDVVTTFPYTEGFENNGIMPNCWSQEYVNGVTNWEFRNGNGVSVSAHGGTINALFFGNQVTTKLISPTFDLTQVDNPYVSFWHTQEKYSDPSGSVYQDELKIYYRTDFTNPWVQIKHYPDNISSWTFDTLHLPSPSNTYQIAFEGIGRYGNTVTLDDITVDGTATGIEDFTLSNSISLYPNPTSNYIDVKFNQDLRVSRLDIYDIYGKLLQTIQVNENPTRINVSGLANGVYIVRAHTEKGIANKSFIKR